LADAIGDDANFATTLTTSVGTKVSKAGDTMTGALTLSGAPTSGLHAATKDYADGIGSTASADATTKSDAAEADAISAAASDATSKVAAEAALRVSGDAASVSTASADATTKANAAQAAAASDATTKANAAQAAAASDATSKANAAQAAAISAAASDATTKANAALTSAQTYADALTTADVAEVTNLYFTAARAVTALQNVTPNFTEVEVNSVAKQVAATSSAPTAGVQMAYAWPKSAYRSAEFLVKVGAGVNTEVSKVLLTLDTADNIAITEYGIVATNVSLAGVSAVVSGSNVELRVTTLNNTSVITVVGTLLV